MANGPTIKTYSALDIEKYQKGLLSPAEMHAMEKAALEDPFLADAMEGYADAGANLQADLSDLRNRLAQRTEEKTKVIPIGAAGKSSFPWMRAAIMIGVLTGAGVLAYFLMFNEPKNEIAQVKNTPVPVSDVYKRQTFRNPSGNRSFDNLTFSCCPRLTGLGYILNSLAFPDFFASFKESNV